jgi:DNA-binding transcriptional MerR regulator
MKQISIASLERFADIKAHTFRAWEQRYSFLKPHRTRTNYRYYTVSQLSELLDIALLKRSGYKISTIDKLGSLTIKKIVQEIEDVEVRKTREINLLIVSMYLGNIEEFEDILDKCVYYWGIDHTIQDIIVPFLDLVQLSSYKDTSNEVHFVVTALRKKLISGIENTKPLAKVGRKALFFLPQNEHFDLVLLYMNYIAKQLGYTTLYMGTNIPVENLKEAIAQKSPDLVLTYLTQKGHFSIQKLSNLLGETLPPSTLVITGLARLPKDTLGSNVKFMEHNTLGEYLRGLLP